MYCNTSLIKSNAKNFSKFNKKDPLTKLLVVTKYRCSICKRENHNHRSKVFRKVDTLKRHVEHVHKNFSDIETGLTYEKMIELVKKLDDVVSWGLIY